jgi:hypothetical protein
MAWEEAYTKKNIAIVLDDVVYSAPFSGRTNFRW